LYERAEPAIVEGDAALCCGHDKLAVL